jgi:hypothetical protein
MASIANKKGGSGGSKKTLVGLVLGFFLYMYYFSLLELVEGLYCKRPIQCLASSDLLTPHPLTARRVCISRLWCGGRTHSLEGEGVGGQ